MSSKISETRVPSDLSLNVSALVYHSALYYENAVIHNYFRRAMNLVFPSFSNSVFAATTVKFGPEHVR